MFIWHELHMGFYKRLEYVFGTRLAKQPEAAGPKNVELTTELATEMAVLVPEAASPKNAQSEIRKASRLPSVNVHAATTTTGVKTTRWANRSHSAGTATWEAVEIPAAATDISDEDVRNRSCCCCCRFLFRWIAVFPHVRMDFLFGATVFSVYFAIMAYLVSIDQTPSSTAKTS
jgi:hypothetical protein